VPGSGGNDVAVDDGGLVHVRRSALFGVHGTLGNRGDLAALNDVGRG
jgi:hypothetical protein